MGTEINEYICTHLCTKLTQKLLHFLKFSETTRDVITSHFVVRSDLRFIMQYKIRLWKLLIWQRTSNKLVLEFTLKTSKTFNMVFNIRFNSPLTTGTNATAAAGGIFTGLDIVKILARKSGVEVR